MSSLCPDRSVLEQFDSLAGRHRHDLLLHVAECSACRVSLLKDDPARVFALLALEPVAPQVLAAVSAAVAGRLAADEAPRRPWAPVAGWAAAAILAVFVARTLSGPLKPPDTVAAMTASIRGPRADVEVLSPAGPRQVVDLSIGDSQVVMIFDERLRL